MLVSLTPKKKKSKTNRISIKAKFIKLNKLESFIDAIDADELNIYDKNLSALVSRFEKTFSIVYAAGGLVHDNQNNLLLIYRRNKWDLPKGKIDAKETPMQAARREVQEETGVINLKVKDLITISRYIYQDNGKPFLKVVYWYHMKTKFQGPLIPETKEQITEVQWKSKSEILKITEDKMYKNIARLIQSLH